MYSKETVKTAVERLRARIDVYASDLDGVHACISKGNAKIGHTLNVSIAPIVTCANCSGCARFCYDIKAVMAYRNVLNARAKNTALALYNRARYFDDVRNACRTRKTNKFFRWHVSGDIVDADYFRNMIDIAREFPAFRFWTYTKNYTVVNAWLNENGGRLPDNLVVMFSQWRGMPMENPYNMPEFRVAMKGETMPDGARVCCGNCNVCIRNCSHCVGGETVYCREH